jgi:hypothetical protein
VWGGTYMGRAGLVGEARFLGFWAMLALPLCWLAGIGGICAVPKGSERRRWRSRR